MFSFILNPFNIFKPIVDPVLKIGDAFISIALLIVKLLSWIPKLIDIVLNLFNPVVFIKDILNGVFKGITLIIEGVIDIVFNTPREKGDKVDIGKNGIFPGGIFGTNNKDGSPKPNATCVPPSTLKLILMILCPPYVVFNKYGLLRGWHLTILCCLLTYWYYFPGLMFASLHVLCMG